MESAGPFVFFLGSTLFFFVAADNDDFRPRRDAAASVEFRMIRLPPFSRCKTVIVMQNRLCECSSAPPPFLLPEQNLSRETSVSCSEGNLIRLGGVGLQKVVHGAKSWPVLRGFREEPSGYLVTIVNVKSAIAKPGLLLDRSSRHHRWLAARSAQMRSDASYSIGLQSLRLWR